MGNQENPTARDISERLLDITGDALMTGKFDPFAAVFHLPHVISTAGGRTTITTRDELRKVFEKMSQQFKSMGVTELLRVCESAEFVSPTRIKTTHVSHLMRHGTRLSPPYPVLSSVELIDGEWLIVNGDYDLETFSPQARAIHGDA